MLALFDALSLALGTLDNQSRAIFLHLEVVQRSHGGLGGLVGLELNKSVLLADSGGGSLFGTNGRPRNLTELGELKGNVREGIINYSNSNNLSNFNKGKLLFSN